METLSTIDTMASELLAEMPGILEQGIEYGGDLFMRFWNYAIVIESLKVAIGSVGLLICIIIFTKGGRIVKENRWNSQGEAMMAASIMFGLIATALLAHGLHGLITAIFLPEIYIINFFQ